MLSRSRLHAGSTQFRFGPAYLAALVSTNRAKSWGERVKCPICGAYHAFGPKPKRRNWGTFPIRRLVPVPQLWGIVRDVGGRVRRRMPLFQPMQAQRYRQRRSLCPYSPAVVGLEPQQRHRPRPGTAAAPIRRRGVIDLLSDSCS